MKRGTLVGVCLTSLTLGGLLQAQSTIPSNRSAARRAQTRLAAGKLQMKTGPMRKVGTQLAELYEEFDAYRSRNSLLRRRGAFKPSNPLIQMHGDQVAIEAIAKGDPQVLLTEMKDLGLQKGIVRRNFVAGLLPAISLRSLASSENLVAAQPTAAQTQAGLVDSQGDQAMNSDLVRSQFGIDGSGIRVGVLSDSFDCLGGTATDQANDDLPADVIILQDLPGCGGGTDEGRAIGQLIHDVAPGASQAFHTAFISQASFAQGIIDLVNVAGSKVVVDDVIFFAEPMFQDGVIAQAVDTVASQGVSYFSSAGNNSRDAYESPFRNSGITGVFGGIRHDFDPGPGVDDLQGFILGTGLTVFSFQWDQPFASVSGAPGSASDVDIILYLQGGIFIGLGGFAGNLGGDAVEVFGVINSGPPLLVELGLELFAGPEPGFMKYVFSGPNSDQVADFPTDSGSLYGHSNAAGAEAVGAAFYARTPEFGQSPPLLEGFSSAGPTPIFFDVNGNPISVLRNKPEIVGPDGGNTTFFGFDIEPDGFPNFFGTSASAPHAAAVGALLKQTNSGLSPSDVFDLLEGTAVDMDAPGFDFDTGFGLVNALPAVDGAATDPNKPKKRLVCHNANNPHTISISQNAVPAHLGHGDKFGPCPVEH